MRRLIVPAILIACAVALVGALLPFLSACSEPAYAQSIGGGGGGGPHGALCSDPVTSTITFSGVATDITTATNEALTLAPAGTGDVILDPGGDDIELFGVGAINVTSSRITMYGVSGGGTMTLGVSGEGVSMGGKTDYTATQKALQFGDALDSSGFVSLALYGERTAAFVPGDALTISSPTDTSSTPLGSGTTGAGTGCRMSAAGAAAWTPSETGAADGMFWCCTNTGANAITMTDSDGVYEGPGSVVGQYDQVCFEYVTDRFIERSFSNNEP